MKFLFAVPAFLAMAHAMDISVDSQAGMHLLSSARRLDQANEEINFNWVSGYSVKFQGCHQIKQWNGNADGDNDVKIATKRLIRFRLCPSDSCSTNKAAGCSSGYGDYIIDMDTFMNSYMEAKERNIEAACQNHLANNCACNDDDGKADDFNAEYCEYDCFFNAGMTECIDRNPYQDDQGGEEEEFRLEEFMECKQVEMNNNNNNANNGGDDANAAVQYYVGPYCGEQGGGVFLGLFTDDTCSTFAETVTYYDLTGMVLPYSKKSMVTSECLGCVESNNAEEQNQNDQNDGDQVLESCENLYIYSGKCEAKLPTGVVATPNYNACNYMEGIRVVRKDGIIDIGKVRPSAVATAFSVIFAMAFCAMAFYVWYLRTRLGVKRNALL